MRERRWLQGAVAVLALVPVGAGLAGVLSGSAMVAGSIADAALDSHVRYLSGLLLAVGLGFWSTVPRIADAGARFRLLTAIVVMGGLGRLLGLFLTGVPPLPMVLALGMELVVTPLLCLWQARFARREAAVGL